MLGRDAVLEEEWHVATLGVAQIHGAVDGSLLDRLLQNSCYSRQAESRLDEMAPHTHLRIGRSLP